jgi:deazaflavin-dependent oxidoreductase (nitroreductase family)
MSRHPLRRALVTGAKVPVAADHRGMRWLLNGKVMPGGPIVILTHRGRRTGRSYTTPVEALVEDGERSEIIVTPLRGERADWYLNVLAGGLDQVRLRGLSYTAECRRLMNDEALQVLSRYVKEHPIFGRIVLMGMARGRDESDDRLTAAAKAAPLLALRTEPSGDAPGK